MRPPPTAAASRCALLAGAAVLLAGCGHSAPTRFFTLDPVAASVGPGGAYRGPPVRVLAVAIPPALDREELVSEEAGGEVRVHDFEHWEAPLGQTARQVLVQDLAGRLPAGAVLAPAAPGGEGVANLTAEVVAFHAGPEGARMQAAWSLTLPGRPGAPEPQVWRAPLLELRAPVIGVGGAATAEAFSALLGQLSDRIADHLPLQAANLQSRQAAALAASTRADHPTMRTTTTTMTVRQSSRGPAQP